MAVVTAALRARLELPYILRLTQGGRDAEIAKTAATEHVTRVVSRGYFVLPIPPQQFTPRQSTRMGLMHTRDGAIGDEQGVSPPEWEMSGQFLHTIIGGYSLFTWQRALEEFVEYYALENRKRSRDRSPLLRMSLHDLYADDHWFVNPMNVPKGVRSNSSPTTERWDLKLQGINRADNKLAIPTSAARLALDSSASTELAGLSV